MRLLKYILKQLIRMIVLRKRTYKTKPLSQEKQEELNFSQSQIKGFSLEKAQKARILLIGAGGIGGHVLLGLIRKGYGFITNLDFDVVDTRNCSRQLFFKKDLGKHKVFCLAKNILSHGLFPATIQTIPFKLERMLAKGMDFSTYDVIVVGVDNSIARVEATRLGLKLGIPVILGAVSGDGNELSVWISSAEKGDACFVCMQADAFDDRKFSCDEGGIIDVLQVVSGLMIYAVDSVISGRNRQWNYRSIALNGGRPETSKVVEIRNDCQLCKDR